MNITIRATRYRLTPDVEAILREKLSATAKLLGEKADTAILELEIEDAPPEGRSSEPCRLVARLVVDSDVYRAEAVKPSPATAADRVRDDLEAEIRSARGKARRLIRRGGAVIKNMLRFGR